MEHPAAAPKCEESGNIRYWTLDGYFYSDEACKSEITEADTIIGATDHDWNAPTYEWSTDRSTCTAKRTCKNDTSHVETETSNTTSRKVKDPTCEEKGVTTYTAEFTNTIFENQELTEANIDALNHDWNAPTYTWSDDMSVCVANRTCKNNASHVETEIAGSNSELTKAPNCEEPGINTYTAVFTNSSFETQTKNVMEIPALGHDWGKPTYEWNYADGEWKCTAARTCGRNDTHIETETVTAANAVTKDATCEDKGDTTYTATFTNPSFAAQTKTVTDIDARGHRFLNFLKWVWESFDNAVAWLFCDNDHDHIETVDVPSSVEQFIPATCEEEGGIYHIATIDVAGQIQTTYKYEYIEPLGHNWVHSVWFWNFFDDDYNRLDIPEAAVIFLCERDNDHVLRIPADVTKDENDKGITYTATAEYDGKIYTTSAFFPKDTPDIPTPDVPTPDDPTPDVPTPDDPIPDVPTPDDPTPDAPTPDDPTPDVPTPDISTPDEPIPDVPTPGVPTPDDPTPDERTPDEPEPAKEISGILGDVNNDGVVDSSDALLILRKSVGLENFDDTQRFLGDVNEDDENIDSSDALSVLRYSVGIIGIEKIGTPVSKTVA